MNIFNNNHGILAQLGLVTPRRTWLLLIGGILAVAVLGWVVVSSPGSPLGRRLAASNLGTNPRYTGVVHYRLRVIGRLPGTDASLPQSIDARGDVAGLSGGVAAANPTLVGLDADPESNSQMFLYQGGHLRMLPVPHVPHTSLSPVNIVVASPNLVAATFSTGGSVIAFYADVRGTRAHWLRLPMSRWTAGDDSEVTSSDGRGDFYGVSPNDGGVGALAWLRTVSGGYRMMPLESNQILNVQRAFIVAEDPSLDLAGYQPGADSWSRGVIVYPRGSSHGRALWAPVPPPTKDPYLEPYAYGIADAGSAGKGVRRVYVLGETQFTSHVVDDLRWTVGISTGRVGRVLWATPPTVIRGVNGYTDLIMDSNESISAGSITSDGRVLGSMGKWRSKQLTAWCASSALTYNGPVQQVTAPYCWSTHYQLRGFLYFGGQTHDLNTLVANRAAWVIEGATAGAQATSYNQGSAMNARGDIIAIGYQNIPRPKLLQQCRTSPQWHSFRHLCAITARRGPETALLLTPVR